jgi:hypothetical protein
MSTITQNYQSFTFFVNGIKNTAKKERKGKKRGKKNG